jgi:hypothetical protein
MQTKGDSICGREESEMVRAVLSLPGMFAYVFRAKLLYGNKPYNEVLHSEFYGKILGG